MRVDLNLHECAVTRIADERVLMDTPFLILRSGEPMPADYRLLASSADCSLGCSIYTRAARRAS